MAKTKCCALKFLILLLIVATGGVLIWYYLPENTRSDLEDSWNFTAPNIPGFPTPSPGTAAPTFGFNVCSNPFDCCNGADVCDQPVNAVMFATPHNSMSSLENGFLLGYNHEQSLESALQRGYRGLNLDIGRCEGEYRLLHGLCFAGHRNPGEVFSGIDDFLQRNPNEVLLITLQIVNEADEAVDLNDVYNIMAEHGLADHLYQHDPNNEWPSLQTLITRGTRVLLFQFNGPNCDIDVACPPGFHDWFEYAVESPFEFGSVDDLANSTNSCSINGRGENGRRDFWGINVFVSNPIPSQRAAKTVNAKEFLDEHLDECTNLNNGLDINVVSVDFWNEGDVVEVVQLRNNELAQARRRERRLGARERVGT